VSTLRNVRIRSLPYFISHIAQLSTSEAVMESRLISIPSRDRDIMMSGADLVNLIIYNDAIINYEFN